MIKHILLNENQKTSKHRPPLQAQKETFSFHFSFPFRFYFHSSKLVDKFLDLVFDLKTRGAGASAVSIFPLKNPVSLTQPSF